MISPEAQIEPTDLVAIPAGTLNKVVALLMQLPAGQSMELILEIQQQAEEIPKGK